MINLPVDNSVENLLVKCGKMWKNKRYQYLSSNYAQGWMRVMNE